MIHLMRNEEKIIKRLRNSAMSYLARYEVSIDQFENTMKRKLSNFQPVSYTHLTLPTIYSV